MKNSWYRRRRGSGAGTLRRYIVLQLPGWLLASLLALSLARWTDLPAWAASVLLGVWVAKDFVVYPWLRASYQLDPRTPAEQQLVGKRGVVTQAVAPRGYVRLQGELWRAEPVDQSDAIPAGATVEVVSVRGLTLLVRRSSARPTTGRDSRA